MNFLTCKLKDCIIVEPSIFEDHRGFFIESYNIDKFSKNGITDIFVQDNHSKSVKGTLRGLHFQKNPKAQGKLVRCTQGAIYDVAVDLRKDSPTFSQWFGIELTEKNKKMFFIPKGFAHGFYVLSETAEFMYKCSDTYAPETEQGLMWNDPTLNIQWPEGEKILSKKDEQNLVLNQLTYF